MDAPRASGCADAKQTSAMQARVGQYSFMFTWHEEEDRLAFMRPLSLLNFDIYYYQLHDFFACQLRIEYQHVTLGVAHDSRSDWKWWVPSAVPEEDVHILRMTSQYAILELVCM